MIRLHSTKKLVAKLPLDASGRLLSKKRPPEAASDEPDSPLSISARQFDNLAASPAWSVCVR